MSVDPGSYQGETTQIGGKTYTWDGIKWNANPVEAVVDTEHVQLAQGIDVSTGKLNKYQDGYPKPDYLYTQTEANDFYYVATQWLRNKILTDGGAAPGESGGAILIQSGTPNPLNYEEGTLWVDEDTYDLFVLSGGQWIDLTTSPDLSQYAKSIDVDNQLTNYLTKSEARAEYYPSDKFLHFINPNGTFKVQLADGSDFDNIYQRLIDLERAMHHLQGGNTGEPPEDPNHPGGQYLMADPYAGVVNSGEWRPSYNVNAWYQLTTIYVSDTDLEGDTFDWAAHQGEFLQVHKYVDDPHEGADYSCSAVFKVGPSNDYNGYDTVNLTLIANTNHGVPTNGDTFTFEIIDEGTF